MANPEYTTLVRWTGNTGEGTRSYRSYRRDWDIAAHGKPVIHCSNDPLLGGNSRLMNPEDLLLSSLSACHMLWFLHLASESGIVVHAYEDEPAALGENLAEGSGRFLSAELRPRITLGPNSDVQRAAAIHHEIHRYCFIARSINFPVTYAPEFEISTEN